MTEVINFLSEMFTSGLEYNTLGVYRSAISAFHDTVQGLPVGQHPRIATFMAGVDNLRPPQPKLTFVWDVEILENYLRGIKDADLPWRDMNRKLVALLSLAEAKRAADLFLLDTRWCLMREEEIEFRLTAKPKHHRKKGKVPKPVIFRASGEELCPVKSLKHYLDLTKNARGNEGSEKLFLSHLKPNKSVGCDSIRRWLKEALKDAGIDTAMFQGHSIRAATSSKAAVRGMSVKEILGMGSWSKNSVWQKFYNKEIR